MAGIGDYVHARFLRLQKYGLSTGPDTKKLVVNHSAFISDLVKQNNWVATPTLIKKAKALEDIYNLKKIDGKALITDNQFKTLHQNILDAIDQQFHKYMNKIVITKEGQCKLKAGSGVNNPLQMGLINDQLAYNTIEKLFALGGEINSLQNTLKNDGQIINQAGEKASYTLAELQRDKSKLLNVFRQWFQGLSKNSTWSQTKNYIEKLEVGGMPIKKFLNTYSMRGKGTNQAIGPAPIITKSGRKSRKKTVTEEMIKDCNELIAKYTQYTPLTAIQGLYNELYAKMMPEFIQQNVNSISEKLLKEFGDSMELTHVGTASSETRILDCIASKVSVDKVDKITDLKGAVETAIVSANSAASIDNYSSTSKADVVITWDTKISAGISVKSMSHNSDGLKYIKLVDGTNLLYYMGNWKIPFANTFLNLFATHVDDKNESRVKDFEKKKQMVSSFAVQTIAIQALTGYNLGREGSHMAQLFAYRDVNKGHGEWTVVPTAIIMNRIMKLVRKERFLNTKGGLGLKVEIGGNNISHLKLNNAWVGNIDNPNYNEAKLRLATLIADMHSKKIYVSMQFSKYVGSINLSDI